MGGLERLMYRNERWMYREGRPNRLAAFLNRIWAWVGAAGLGRNRLVTVEVRGWRSGRVRSFPLIVADRDGERYLVSMLGERAAWVANVRAAGGEAVLRHGRREPIRLEEVEPGLRGPILRRHLEVAPAARSFVPVDRRAPLAELEAIAPQFPVFRIVPRAPASEPVTESAAETARSRRHRRRWIAGGIVILVVVVAGGVLLFANTYSEPPLALPAAAPRPPAGPLAGAWDVAAGSLAGFRVEQTVLFTSGAVVGRTKDVTGSVVASSDAVTSGSFAVNLAAITAAGKPQPQFAQSLDVKDYPQARFVLAGPLALPAGFATGATVDLRAAGELTMHGATHAVTATLSTRRDGTSVEVVGSIPVTLADWGIAGPTSYGPLASVADRGSAEFLLVLTHR